jgi:serine protease AprX
MCRSIRTSARQITSLVLATLLGFGSASAGVVVTAGDGIAMTGADGIAMTGADGIAMTGADGFLSFGVNGIAMTGADGIAMTGADGIAMTGADGIAMTGADGIAMTGVDSATAYGVNGIAMTGADGIAMTGADGIAMTGADGIAMTGADNFVAKAADGRTFSLPAKGLSVTGADTVTVTGADDIRVTGADSIRRTGPGASAAADAAAAQYSGLRSVDPELAVALDRMTDDSTINAVVVFHRRPADQDLADLQRVGVIGGTRFRVLPAVYVTGTRDQLVEISRLSSVRSIYGNRTLQLTEAPGRGVTGVERARLSVSGRGVTVAVLDTGVDATHADFAGRVARNVKLADAQTAGAGFAYPSNVEGLPNTDQAYGHGTLVAGVIGGSGARSGGQYAGVAPGARLVGLSAGDLSLVHVLSGFDYLLAQGAAAGVRVVNCSFSAAAVYDANDPVNVATKMLTERGVNVVFSAGNTGPGLHTLNPYAAAPWVVSVGAMEGGRVAAFSSRGSFGSAQFRPTLVAPGVRVVGARAAGANVTGAEGVGFNNDLGLAPTHIPYYTQATGTSFSAPQVAGAIALMLEVNPRLTPAEVRDILRRTATPLAPYYAHEVGAGMLNAHAAVLEAAFPARLLGHFRARDEHHERVRYVAEPLEIFTGTVAPGAPGYATTFEVPEGTLLASVQIGWGPLWSLNDLGLAVSDPNGVRRADVNGVNLPGLAGRRERALLARPAAGAWRVAVRNTLGPAGTPQAVTGVVEIMRAEYPQMRDIGALTAAQREDVWQSLRSHALAPVGHNFRPAAAVTRSELAAALVAAGRVPQYMPGAPTFRDVRDRATMLAVESCQHSPRGALFHGTEAGGAFWPHAPADRLAAAVALVRAAGLQAEAEAKAGDPLLGLTDGVSVPATLRGYVSVALARGLLAPDQSAFRPQTALTRLDLARATAALQELLGK